MARLSADDRRRQLIGIGLRLLVTTPIHELSLDAVAAEAGISRSLLFHYFPTKRDYYAAVVGAASRRMLRESEPTTVGSDPLHAMVDQLTAFIDRHLDAYVAFVRGAAGGDPWIGEIFEQTRGQLVDRFLAALESGVTADDPLLRLQVRGWVAYAEELALQWARHHQPAARAELVDLLTRSLRALAAVTA